MKLSVVLAAQNEEENIGDCLDSVKQIADEMIVVDDGSNDFTPSVIRSLQSKVAPGRALISLRQENGGRAVAVNLGIRALLKN